MSSDRIETPGKAFRAIAEWRGAIRVASWLSLICVPILCTGLGVVFSKIADGSEVNRVQDNRIDTIEKRAAEDREQQRRRDEWMADKLERIADRVGAAK